MELQGLEANLSLAVNPNELKADIAAESSELSQEAEQILSIADTSNTTLETAETAAELKSLTSDQVLQASDTIIYPIPLIIGTPKSDLLIGGNNGDFIFALESSDFIDGNGGADTIYPGSGSDFAAGGDGNDRFRQWSGSRFVDGSGDDILFGGSGTDTADYRYLNQAITLEAGGSINKGKLGTDQIFDVEVVQGNENKSNSIDASTGNGNASIEVNLFSEQLTVKDVPTLGDLDFTVENFVNVSGSHKADQITGDNQNNRLSGLGGNDNISGLGGQDKIDGGSGNDVVRGDAGNDNVQGGSGDDTVQGGWGDDYIVGVGGGSVSYFFRCSF